MEILPSDKESARNWANLLIDIELRKKYLTEKEWESLQEKVLKRTEFESFRLEIVSLTQKLQSLKKAGEKPIEFFHLATPYHLNPYKKERALDKFTVTETTEGDLKKVVLEKLHCPTSKIKILIYSDRYVQSSSQREKFQEVVNYFSTFSSSLKVILLSISKSNQTNFQFAPNVKFEFQELKKGIDNHERFLLIQYEDKYWDIWKITHGIDFFERVNGIYKYKNCSFIKLETSELPNYLKDLYHEFN